MASGHVQLNLVDLPTGPDFHSCLVPVSVISAPGALVTT